MRILGIIPDRYESTRFPGKPLHLIAGKPLIDLAMADGCCGSEAGQYSSADVADSK